MAVNASEDKLSASMHNPQLSSADTSTNLIIGLFQYSVMSMKDFFSSFPHSKETELQREIVQKVFIPLPPPPPTSSTSEKNHYKSLRIPLGVKLSS
jgi:hypothetical protein